MRSAAAAVILGVLAAAGCGPTRGTEAPAALGPAEVLAAHNAWADSIQHVWSRAAVMLNFPQGEKAGDRAEYDTDGHFFLQKPCCLFLHGQVLGQEVFKLGMNDERFWLWVRPRVDTIWFGRRGGPGEHNFVFSPADLMAALGVMRIDLAPDALACFDRLPQAHVLSEYRRATGGVVPLRRTWFDRRTLRPVRVDLFDDTGRCILMAELMEYEQVGQTLVCTVYRLRFYGQAEVDLVLALSRVSLEKKVPPAVFELRVPPGAKQVDLDAKPEEQGTPSLDPGALGS